MQPLKTTVSAELRVDHRLGAGRGQVDDRQPPVAERDRPVRPHPAAVGPARRQAGACPLHGRDVRRAAVEADLACQAAHAGGLLVGRVSVGGRGCVAQSSSASAMIQVSLAPPPRDEFTTMLPAGATRVSARSARCTWSAPVPSQVDERAQVDVPRLEVVAGQRRVRGQRDDLLRDPARRRLLDRAPALVELVPRRRGPDQYAAAAVAVDRLGDQLVEPVQHRAELVGVPAAVGRHGGEQRPLVEVVADDVRDDAVHRLVVGHARAGHVRQHDVAVARGLQDARADRCRPARCAGRRARRPGAGRARPRACRPPSPGRWPPRSRWVRPAAARRSPRSSGARTTRSCPRRRTAARPSGSAATRCRAACGRSGRTSCGGRGSRRRRSARAAPRASAAGCRSRNRRRTAPGCCPRAPASRRARRVPGRSRSPAR